MEKKRLKLSFFWHMHQPDYRGDDGVMKMPWVFLHAIKDYYEMPWLLSLYGGLKATFNITSPLIEQLHLYKQPTKNDYFLSLWALHPSKLDDISKQWLIKTCKSTQYDTMVKPLVRFDELYHQELLNDEELVEFEVLFMLAWCGNYLRQENSFVQKLLLKGYGFTQDDKEKLLTTLTQFVQTILPFYASLQEQGKISLSTTPYNHPILPLLLDMNNAKKADENTTIPSKHISLKEDAIEQIERSIALYKQTFKVAPRGFWPAEGAVDEESIALYKEYEIKWIATDEAILFKSLNTDERKYLYKPYSYDGVSIGFRDHELSNLIGFNYRFEKGSDASEHFMNALRGIYDTQKDPTVFVILDGENAWEFFQNNGYDFFTTLYEKLSQSSWCQSVTMDEVDHYEDIPTLQTLAPGSWIYGNFNTWSGNAEKNRAWELLYKAKDDYKNHKGYVGEDIAQKITYHFLAAECSDWFWWYGDDHVTEFAFEFDTLFREHLISIYRLSNQKVPPVLFDPIIKKKISESFLSYPQSSISPIIDGQKSSFFEWLGSGYINENKLFSTMDMVRGPIKMIYFGHNHKFAFFAFDGEIEQLSLSEVKLTITIQESDTRHSFSLNKVYSELNIKLAVAQRIELALPKAFFKGYSSVHLRFDLVEKGRTLQSMPGFGSIHIDFKEKYRNNWFV